jgi:2Fe-2S ferredoxin
MPIVTFIRFDGETQQARGDLGQSVMRVALNAGVPGIIADCGGAATCATCHIYIDAGWVEKLPPPSRDEAEMILCAVDPDERSRLSCQILLTEQLDGLVVHVPENQI